MSRADVHAVRVRPGQGRLCRVTEGVVFTPAPGPGWDAMVAAATGVDGGDLVAAVAAVIADRGLEAPPLVVLSWQPRLAVLVFGEVELETDHPAVPLLTGRGSRTWVEHSLPGGTDTMQLWVEPPEEDDDTDVLAGVIPAAGLRVELARSTATAGMHPPAAPEPPAGPAAGPATVPPPATGPQADTTPRAPGAPDTATTPRAPGAPERQRASTPRSDEPPGPVPGTSPDPTAAGSEEHERTEVRRRPMVDAVRCADGHLNPPGSSSCRRCQKLLPPDAATEVVACPPLGTVRLDDGAEFVVVDDVLLGRRPPEDGRRRYVVTGDRVSRHHAELQVRGWDVLLHDPGSRNGMYVARPGATEPVRVDPEAPTRLEHGSRVYLGTRAFTYLAPDDRGAGPTDHGTPGPTHHRTDPTPDPDATIDRGDGHP